MSISPSARTLRKKWSLFGGASAPWFAAALAVAWCGAAGCQAVEADPPPMPEETYYLEPPGYSVEDYITDLEVVWDFAFLPDDRLLFTERPGRIRVASPDGELQPEPWASPENVYHSGGGGMMGLALYPDFEAEPWVYAMYTLDTEDGPENRVVRYRDGGAQGTDKEVILDHLPAANTHNGGRIAFGPEDGMLYVTIGDTGQAGAAQDIHNLRGSILRVTPEGAIPEDNPWPDTPVWATGLRNVHGLAFHPDTGALFAADHGPTGRDQMHIVEGGKNYGWPHVFGAAGHEDYEDPILEWTPAAPPGALAFYDGDLMPELQGDLLFTTLRSSALIRIQFDDADDPHRPTAIERWFAEEDLGDAPYGSPDSAHGRLRAIAVGPDGALYMGTSNIDRNRGHIQDGDDRIVRIAPAE